VTDIPAIVTLLLKRLQNGVRFDCWSKKCDMTLFNKEMLLTKKCTANECCLSVHLTKEYGMKVLLNSLMMRLCRPKREKASEDWRKFRTDVHRN
jgi:hypothetical protein